MFNYSNTAIWLWLIKYWNRSSPRGVKKDVGFILSLYTTWSGAGRRLRLTSKQTHYHHYKLLNHILLLKTEFPFTSPDRISLSRVWIRKKIISLTSCCFSEPSSLSRAWNQCARLLSESDYSRSVPWLQPETGHCLLICGLNTETGKSQGSYQGYLESAAPFYDRFIIKLLTNTQLLSLAFPACWFKHVVLAWDCIYLFVQTGLWTVTCMTSFYGCSSTNPVWM